MKGSHQPGAFARLRAHATRRPDEDPAIASIEGDLTICIQSVAGGKLLVQAPAYDDAHRAEVERLRAAMAHPQTGTADCDRLLRGLGSLRARNPIIARAIDVQLDFMADHLHGLRVDGPWLVFGKVRDECVETCRQQADLTDRELTALHCAR